VATVDAFAAGYTDGLRGSRTDRAKPVRRASFRIVIVVKRKSAATAITGNAGNRPPQSRAGR
jgi:hypothetical protein